MMKFDHLTLPVSDVKHSRSWYVDTLGLTVEFEVPDRQAVAVQDGDGFTIFLQQVATAVAPNGLALYFQVSDVDATFGAWCARGVAFTHAPTKRTGATGPSCGTPTAI